MTDLLRIHDLTISVDGPTGQKNVVKDCTWSVGAGQSIGIVGESGSGKSLTGLALLGLLPAQATLSSQSTAHFKGRDLFKLTEDEYREVRGDEIAIIFQEPMACLHPLKRVGAQVSEAISRNKKYSRQQKLQQVLKLFSEVGLPTEDRILRSYPHELSGGQLQRVMIAMALAGDPAILIADEPTTALDATVQSQILSLLTQLRKTRNLAIVLISHDLNVVASITDNIVVMRTGEIVERGPVQTVLNKPHHGYTKKLVNAGKKMKAGLAESPTHSCGDSEVLRMNNLSIDYRSNGLWVDHFRAVDSVSLSLKKGSVLGLIGESGSGKSTIGKTVAGLLRPTKGELWICGHHITHERAKFPRELRKICQIILQNSSTALNPRMTIGLSLAEPIHTLGLSRETSIAERLELALREVSLEADLLGRYPHQLSGGQRQRVCIARALISRPEVVVCDEIISALDSNVCLEILDLLKRLQKERNLSLLFIGHDIDAVGYISDEIAILNDGRIVESGHTSNVLNNPVESYSQELVSAGFRNAC